MNIIDANYPRMRDARKEMMARVEEYNREVTRIAETSAELRSQWEGDAGTAFEAEQASAVAFYNQMAGRMARCADALAGAAARYAEADYAVAEIIRAANH